jgi:hypothetical protein
MVLNDCFDFPDIESYVPPPWKADLRIQLDRLIEAYPDQSTQFRSGIEFAFSDFQCEQMLNHFEDWSEPHLFAYAKMVRIADRTYEEFLEREARSPSAVKRTRAVRAIRFLGAQGRLLDIASAALFDKQETVRIEAIYAIASGHNREEAIELLRPFLGDSDKSVQVAANQALAQLEAR